MRLTATVTTWSFLFLALCSSCRTSAPTDSLFVQRTSDYKRKLVLRKGKRLTLVAERSWEIIDIDLSPTNYVLLVKNKWYPNGIKRVTGLTSIESPPQLTATILSRKTGQSYTVRISDRPDRTFVIDNIRYQVVDIRPDKQTVVLKDTETSMKFIIGPGMEEAEPNNAFNRTR